MVAQEARRHAGPRRRRRRRLTMADDRRSRPSRSTHCDFEAKVTRRRQRPAARLPAPAGGPRWDAFLDGLAEQPHGLRARPSGHRRDRPRLDLRGRRPVGPRAHLRRAARRARPGRRAARRQLVRRHGGLRARRARAATRDPQARAARPDRPVARRRAGRALHDDVAATSWWRRCSTDLAGAAVQEVLAHARGSRRGSRSRSPTRSGRWARPASSSGRSRTRG